jgi:hypothetical protein
LVQLVETYPVTFQCQQSVPVCNSTELVLSFILFTADPNCTGRSLTLFWFLLLFLLMQLPGGIHLFRQLSYVTRSFSLMSSCSCLRRWAYGPESFTVTHQFQVFLLSFLAWVSTTDPLCLWRMCSCLNAALSPISECANPPTMSINFKCEIIQNFTQN